MKRVTLFTFILLLALNGTPARAIPITGTPLDISWDAALNAVTNLWEYRYHIMNTGPANIVNGLRWTVEEDARRGHAGLHDEVNFLNDGGIFQYDRAKAGFSAHNYDWRNLQLPAGATINLGFNDIHGPTTAEAEIELGAASADLFGLVVPALDTPAGQGEISLDLGGGQKKAYSLQNSWVAAGAGAAGFDYIYRIRNTGNVPIGPTPGHPDNHADFYVNEHPTHAGIHHEVPNQPDNAFAVLAPFFDSRGHHGAGLPPGILAHNYAWEGLGTTGAGLWLPGMTLTLGFHDPHGPGLVGWGGWVVGSSAEGYFDSPSQLAPVPAVPEPSSMLLFGTSIALLWFSAKRLGEITRIVNKRYSTHQPDLNSLPRLHRADPFA